MYERPWEPMDMTTEKWLSVVPTTVRIEWLHPTQDVKSEWVQAKKYNPESSYCGDRFPHVVEYDNKLYISDGHHRIASMKDNGSTYVQVRIFRPAI